MRGGGGFTALASVHLVTYSVADYYIGHTFRRMGVYLPDIINSPIFRRVSTEATRVKEFHS